MGTSAVERNVAQLLLVDGDSVGHIVARVPREARRAFEANREKTALIAAFMAGT